MKLKIVFSEPPEKNIQAAEDETVIMIQAPYTIIQAKSGDTREYEKSDGSKMPEEFTYEQYCQEMRKLISTTIDESNIRDQVYDKIIIEGFSQPSNFKSLCAELEKKPLLCASKSNILFENCSFGGKQYTDSTRGLIRSLQDRHFEQHHKKLTLEIIVADQSAKYLSRHDESRLIMLQNVVFYKNFAQDVVLKPFRDDTIIGTKKGQRTSGLAASTLLYRDALNTSVRDDRIIGAKKGQPILRLAAPTFFYRDAINTLQGQTTAEITLKNFFSQEAQQQSDFTCGPAAVTMVAEYFDTMLKQNFCGASVANQKIWHEIIQTPEMTLAEQVKTTEAEGSAIPDIRKGLIEMGITVFDDTGLSDKNHDEKVLSIHKHLLWDKMHQILKLGIPVILNMQDRDGCGHYEVIIGIERSDKGEHIILAEPGTALNGTLEFEHILKDKFISRWKNMSGEFHGRFMILSPNEESTHAIDRILTDMPHYKNGEDINRESIEPKQFF